MKKYICKKAENTFIDKLVSVYKDANLKDTTDRNIIKRHISRWINHGIKSEITDKLLLPVDKKRDIPIWWSGFFLENRTDINPIGNMKDAAQRLNGFSTLDTFLQEKAIDEQIDYVNSCQDKRNYGVFVSKTYTRLSLQNNPRKIALFLNKSNNDFLKTFFFTLEVGIINKHYKMQNTRVDMYIFNLQNNCDYIVNILRKHFNNIHFICYNNCNTLTECIDDFNNGRLKHKNTHAKTRSKTRTQKRRQKRTKTGSKTHKKRHYLNF